MKSTPAVTILDPTMRTPARWWLLTDKRKIDDRCEKHKAGNDPRLFTACNCL